MALTKKDKGEIRGIVKDEIVDAISEVVIPAIDRVYQKLSDFEADTKRNFADVDRQINDLKMDTPSRREFANHDKRIQRMEYQLGFV